MCVPAAEVGGERPGLGVLCQRLPALTRQARLRPLPPLPPLRRQGVVGAASVHHLCKSIVMENTRAHPSGGCCTVVVGAAPW